MLETLVVLFIVVMTGILLGGIITFLYGVPEALKDIAKQIKNLNQNLYNSKDKEG